MIEHEGRKMQEGWKEHERKEDEGRKKKNRR
jgi:hypothetical protein